MALFADNMKALTGAREATTRRRTCSLAAVSERTRQVLAEARSFPQQVRRTQRQAARVLRTSLDRARRGLVREVGQLRQEVRAAHQEVGRELAAALARNRILRREAVRGMLSGYRSARQELSQDLRDAAQCWRDSTAP